ESANVPGFSGAHSAKVPRWQRLCWRPSLWASRLSVPGLHLHLHLPVPSSAAIRLMLRRLYDWVLRLAAHRHALAAMAVVSFVESSFFPIPPDAMLVPMVLADRRRAFLIALVCTVGSVLGGLLGYAIGYE